MYKDFYNTSLLRYHFFAITSFKYFNRANSSNILKRIEEKSEIKLTPPLAVPTWQI